MPSYTVIIPHYSTPSRKAVSFHTANSKNISKKLRVKNI